MLTAIINQATCVQCTLCIDACPFAAIEGSIGKQHNVLVDTCVGCSLCIEPCPVDCIEMVPLASINKNLDKKQIVMNAKNKRAAKIAHMNEQPTAKLFSKDVVTTDLAAIMEKYIKT